MNIRFEVHSTHVNERSGTARSGNPYKLREQEAWVQIGDAPYPQKTKIMLDEGQTPYQPGEYQLHYSSFSIGKYDSFQVNPVLVPLDSSVKKTA